MATDGMRAARGGASSEEGQRETGEGDADEEEDDGGVLEHGEGLGLGVLLIVNEFLRWLHRHNLRYRGRNFDAISLKRALN